VAHLGGKASLAGCAILFVGVLMVSGVWVEGRGAETGELPPEAPPPQEALPEAPPPRETPADEEPAAAPEPDEPADEPPEVETPAPEPPPAQPEPQPESEPEPEPEPKPEPEPDDAESLPALTGARAWLRGHDVDDSQFERFVDGVPMDGGEREVMLDVMYWLAHLDLTALERWTGGKWQPAELVQNPDDCRGELYFLTGQVTGIEIDAPVPEAIERLDIERYYICRLVRSDGQPALVFARTVPNAWLEGLEDQGSAETETEQSQRPSYRASARGVFLKLESDDPQRPTPVFVATRLAWHPDTPLGNLGMDVGLLDDVVQRRHLTSEDRECFYQMLNAVGRAEPGSLVRRAQEQLRGTGQHQYSVVPLFNDAENQQGRLVCLRGVTRRLIRIPVGDPDVVERFGIDHYYEMALYTEDSQENPLWFCLRDLPEGMPTGDGPRYAEEVQVAGFFMKTWAYRSQETRDEAEGERRARVRLAPLLIGRRPIWYPEQPPERNTTAAAIAGGLFVLALLGIWIGLWHYGRSDRKFHERTIAKTHALDAGLSLDEIGLDAQGKPDFRHLSESGEGE